MPGHLGTPPLFITKIGKKPFISCPQPLAAYRIACNSSRSNGKILRKNFIIRPSTFSGTVDAFTRWR